MNISKLGYELYKLDWERRITTDMKMDLVKEWFQECYTNEITDYSYEDWLFDGGYYGSLYVCYDEFLEAEYLDVDYMKMLFDNDDLFVKYQNDIKESSINDLQ